MMVSNWKNPFASMVFIKNSALSGLNKTQWMENGIIYQKFIIL